MPVLVLNLEEIIEVPFPPGRSVCEILDGTDFRVRTGCSGVGACGLCLVRVEEGETHDPTSAEKLHLEEGSLKGGIRLACQLRPVKDLRISIVNRAPRSTWKKPTSRAARHYPPARRDDPCQDVQSPRGVAVDLGTTFINISLWDLDSGRYLTGRYGLNPQTARGADVLTRLMAAVESEENAQTLHRQVIEGIGLGLRDIAVREGGNLHDIVRLVLVGNTAMLALLKGSNHGALLQPKNWVLPMDCFAVDMTEWSADLGIHPKADAEAVAPLAGFVGSDLLAGLLNTQLVENGPGGLFIDFGTNSEIALWDGKTLWVTSAAGGPAFEGSGISCGMPAEKGAIQKLSMKNGTLEFDVVGGGEPVGVCGTGLVDLLAILVRSHQLDQTGRFVASASPQGLVAGNDSLGLVLTKRDVDFLQRAKAAVGAGIQTLLAAAGMKRKDLRHICVGGAFGRRLDVVNAREIGLLPDIDANNITLCGNTALAGCEDILFSRTSKNQLERLRSCAKIINVSFCEDYDDLYIDNLYLRPISID